MGRVYLVGAGPGDPKLLTIRGAELLAIADFIVYDALVHPAILRRAPETAGREYVGKRGGEPSPSQESITALLVELAGRFDVVVRLKGGDPFVFGRGGEEAEALAAAGIPFEIVPGVTAGLGAPAYAGIPVTYRGVSANVTFVTGHEDPAKGGGDLDWGSLARAGGTMVFYMGVRRMRENLERLIAGGRAADTPAAVIEWGTYARQRTITGTLSTLTAAATAAQIGSPAVVIVGDVVSLRERLTWFETRPLYGKRILVTRARGQASRFAAELEDLGAEVIQFPMIRIAPPSDPIPLARAVEAIGQYAWVVFTSVNAVEHFWAALHGSGRDARALSGISICAIGPATAASVQQHGVRPDLVPPEFVSEAVVEAMSKRSALGGVRVLLPRAEVAREALPRLLSERGARVDDIPTYRTLPDERDVEALRTHLEQGDLDLITFTSSSTVRNFVAAIGTGIGRAEIASIGPITSQTVHETGMTVAVEAKEYTIPGLVLAIREHCRTPQAFS